MGLPERFGDYELVAPVARGGMAEVFLARRVDGAGKSPLCIKRILPEFLRDQEFATMFRDEANLAALLNHPNIIEVYDTGAVDERLYIAMEFVDGLTLRQLVEQQRNHHELLPVDVAVAIAIQLCRALHYAHRLAVDNKPQNIIHRDVTPANVIVGVDGRVRLMDFGIARAADRMTRTLPGLTKGKCPYMSPEQALAKEMDHRSDQFSAAILLWEMLTGTPLFDEPGGAALVLEKVATHEPAPPSDARDGVSRALDRVVLKALEKKPHKRHDDMADFERALVAAAGEPDWGAVQEQLTDLVQNGLADPDAPTVELDGRTFRWSSSAHPALDLDAPTVPQAPAYQAQAKAVSGRDTGPADDDEAGAGTIAPALQAAPKPTPAPRQVTMPDQQAVRPVEPPATRTPTRPKPPPAGATADAGRGPVLVAAGVALVAVVLGALALAVLATDDEATPITAEPVLDTGPCGAPPKAAAELTITKRVWEAEDLLRAGRAGEARARAEAIIKDGATPAAWLIVARAREEQGEAERALAAYGCAVELAPDSREATLARAASARLRGDDERPPPEPPDGDVPDDGATPPPAGEGPPAVAPEDLVPEMKAPRALTAAERRKLRRLERRVAPLLLAGENGKAIRLLEQIVDLSPGSAKAHRNLAMAYRNMGDAARASIYEGRAERLSPGTAPTIELDGDKNDFSLDEEGGGEDAPFGGAR